MPKRVPRIGRVLDLVGLLLFLAGAGVAGRAWMGLRSVPSYVPDLEAGAWAAIRLTNGYVRLQWVGAGLMAVGLAVFVAAWWVAGRTAGEEG